jgi:hypothetical protein
MNTLQIFHDSRASGGSRDNSKLLRHFYKRLKTGWYTVNYRGVNLDDSTICAAKRNKKGELKVS